MHNEIKRKRCIKKEYDCTLHILHIIFCVHHKKLFHADTFLWGISISNFQPNQIAVLIANNLFPYKFYSVVIPFYSVLVSISYI